MISGAEKLRDRNYYKLAHEGSTDLVHPSMKVLLKLFEESHSILDMGCGEGTRLATLAKAAGGKSKQNLFGVDASKIAINLAKKKYTRINFQVGNLEELSFKDGEFDLLISAYVFEHLESPKQVLKEGNRILKVNGRFIIIAPNFGSPNRRSPNSKQNKLFKLIVGFLSDLKTLLKKSNSLNWEKVNPKRESYVIDADTTVEPYLLTLIKYCQSLGFNVEYFSSNWEVDKFSSFHLIFRILGRIGIFPFKYWGPHLAVVLKKYEK